MIERKITSTLDWLADVGGLLFALIGLASLVVIPFSTLSLKTELLTQLFRFVTSRNKQATTDPLPHEKQEIEQNEG